MTPLMLRFESWARSSQWASVLPLDEHPEMPGTYAMPTTLIAFEAWVASQAEVIDMITRQDEEITA